MELGSRGKSRKRTTRKKRFPAGIEGLESPAENQRSAAFSSRLLTDGAIILTRSSFRHSRQQNRYLPDFFRLPSSKKWSGNHLRAQLGITGLIGELTENEC